MTHFLRSPYLSWISPCLFGVMALIIPALPADTTRVLLFHKQNGFIHTATGDIVDRIKADLLSHGIAVETTLDSLAFTAQNLARFKAVVFINTNYRNGPLLARAQEVAFETYLQTGGGFAGIHSAVPLNGTAEEAIWPWYARLFGARFRSHAPYRRASMIIENKNHPSTQGLPTRISLDDEWYAVQTNPRSVAGIQILATVDETGFLPESKMNGDHPVSWHHLFEGARAWMTLVGHDMAAFSNADFLTHIRGGIVWAASSDSATTSLQFTGGRPIEKKAQPELRPSLRGQLDLFSQRNQPKGNRVFLRINGTLIQMHR